MDEKKSIKVSLGTTICIIIIVLLVIALFGMWCYYNKRDNNEIKQTNEYIENSNTTIITTKEDTSKPNVNKSFNEGTYVYSGLNLEDKVMKAKEENSIKFSKDAFTADIGGFIVKGIYEVLDNNELKCILKSDMLKNDPEQKEVDLNEWTIVFSILENKIKVKKYDFPLTESEISIVLYNTFGENQEFTKYEGKTADFIGTWNTKYYKKYKELSDNLSEIFGTSVKYGSYLKLLDNNKFEDCVYPITEGNIHRKGTYTFDGKNKITLKYDDDSSFTVELYIVDDSNLLYDDGTNMFVLNK